jgi:hypothetical protein
MTLPLWLQYCQALALIAIPAIGACLAWQQVQIARVKLQHDLFDRRFRVFDATRRMLANALAKGDLSDENLRLFTLDTGDALFLFDDDLAKYLGKEMWEHVNGLTAMNRALDTPLIEEQQTKFLNKKFEHLTWLSEQITGLADRFKPFLQLEKRQREAGCRHWQVVAMRLSRVRRGIRALSRSRKGGRY